MAATSIPIDVVRAFVAVVEARGFTRAAEELGRSQPTVSLQVKRLEELVEAPLFEKAARFELTAVGSVCFEHGRRLVRLHDAMLDEVGRRKAPDARLRIGLPGEIAERLTPQLDRLRRVAGGAAGFEVVTGDADGLSLAIRENRLDIALALGVERAEAAVASWRAPLGWFSVRGTRAPPPPKVARLVLPPRGSALHEAAAGAMHGAERPFEIVCACADAAVRVAAVSSGLGVAPMIDGFAPQGLERVGGLPPLPPLVVSLLGRTEALAAAGRRWASEAMAAFDAG
ncbi:DNA-binding transcriptional LysR family regulator [Roseiarcus fermentans]|uniref:DNA-binding transcriptional LysR family regulator n=1 Tax=Roseiarcus fermentans TaxID=1473586 RepID=A0A366FNL8_9HYPH|nr:LysR family transcriptional regulator [Roseiarcus fermentans]RBP16161.1 DNA-binding transcriptional LysR family regulator [Roseiarcus fermentans]